MRLQPQRTSRHGWIDPDSGPPGGFVTAAADLAMVSSASGTVNSSLTYGRERSFAHAAGDARPRAGACKSGKAVWPRT